METLGTKPMKAKEYLIAGVVIFTSVVGLTVYSAYFPPHNQMPSTTQQASVSPTQDKSTPTLPQVHVGDSFKSEDITFVCGTKEEAMEFRDGIRAMDNATLSAHLVRNGGGCIYGPEIPLTVVEIDSDDGLVGVRLSYQKDGGIMWTLPKLVGNAMKSGANPSSNP